MLLYLGHDTVSSQLNPRGLEMINSTTLKNKIAQLLDDFYKSAREKFGDKKGCKRNALLEAMQDWLKKESNSKKAKR